MPEIKPAKKIVKYKSKVKVHEEVTKALEGRVTPTPTVKSDDPVKVKPGPKPKAVRNFNDDERSMDLAVYILQGLSVEEAGILAGFSGEELSQLNERSETYRKFVELQLIKFKQKHLKVIDTKDNPSTSQWMLEQKFPETYGKKPKGGEGVGSTHVIQAVIKSVQMQTDTPVIHEHDDSKKSEKEVEGHNKPQLNQGAEPTLEPGGANIL